METLSVRATPAPPVAPVARPVAYPDRSHRTCAEWKGEPVACPDLGDRLSRLMVRRACGVKLEALGREFNLSVDQLRALFDRHGEPPYFAGRDQVVMSQATRPLSAYPPAPTHAAATHPRD
ncbi:MAG: hypothetical protein GC202_02190 [Alphaproteobacteria bacterium]|nr:hypothetical protein [Alphaproteobacteria bacterium]